MTRLVGIVVAAALVGGAAYAGTTGSDWVRGLAAAAGAGATLMLAAATGAGWRLLTTPAGDGYGPYPEDAERFKRFVRRIQRFDRDRAERYKVQRRLRTSVRRALDAQRLDRARAHEEKALETHRDWSAAARGPRGERRALEDALAADLRRLATVRYLRAAQAMVERGEGLKTERGREAARREARDVLSQGFADPEADQAALAAYAREAGLDDPPGGVPARPAARRQAVRDAGEQRPGSASDDARWVPAGEPVVVGGYRIGDGMLWVGTSLAGVATGDDDPVLIAPGRTLARPDRSGGRLARDRAQLVAYADLTPSGRAGFLDWCGEGRDDPSAPETFLLLFLAGLERRVLDDAARDPAAAREVPRLAAELERLARLHPGARSFRAQTAALLDHIALRFRTALAGRHLAPELGGREEVPVRLRIALAAAAVDEGEVRADVELLAALAEAWTAGRTAAAAARTPGAFEALFAARARTWDWPRATPARDRLRSRYRPIGAGFHGTEVACELDLADVRGADDLAAEAARLADDCARELRPLAAWRRERGDEAPTLDLLSRLPAPAAAAVGAAALGELQRTLEAVALPPDGAPQLAPSAALVAAWPAEALSRAECGRFAELLAARGVGVEPDPRHGGARWDPRGRVALYRLRADAPRSASRSAHAATLFVELAAALTRAEAAESAAQGITPDATIAAARVLARRAERAFDLEPAEQQRLLAHAAYRLAAAPGHDARAAKQRLAALDGAARERLAALLVDLARVGGSVAPDEVEALERAYTALGLDAGRVHEDLHEPARTGDAGPAGALLDPSRVRAKVAETEAVAALLGGVFAEEDEERPAPARAATEISYVGLDGPHSALLDDLAAEAQGVADLARTAFEALCARHDLFPDGALETLNDAAFERLGAPLSEGDDPLELDLASLAALRLPGEPDAAGGG